MISTKYINLVQIRRMLLKNTCSLQKPVVHEKYLNVKRCLEKNFSSSTELNECKENVRDAENLVSAESLKKNGNGQLLNDANEEYYNYDECFKEIAKNDPKVERELRKLEFEVALLRDQNFRLPTFIKQKHWENLLKKTSIIQRKKYLTFLFKNERKTVNFKQKALEKKELRIQDYQKNLEEGHIMYGIGHNSLFIRAYEKTLTNLIAEKQFRAMLFSQHIVFDCSYEKYMTDINAKYCAHQLSASIVLNRMHAAPFHVKLCNVNYNDATIKYLNQFMPSTKKPNFPWDFHEESYLDLYPKEKIVYLTPHTKNELRTYNHDDVYVIGAFVDKGSGVKASLAKAKENNLRMAKFPLDEYLIWQKGLKSLPLNIVLGIMLDMRLNEDWNLAFKNVPTRFLTPSNPKWLKDESF